MPYHEPQEGEFILEDRYASDYALPEKDPIQNKELIMASLSDADVTKFIFSMPISNCKDLLYDVAIQPDFMTLVAWARSSFPSYFLAYHGPYRGSLPLPLLASTEKIKVR